MDEGLRHYKIVGCGAATPAHKQTLGGITVHRSVNADEFKLCIERAYSQATFNLGDNDEIDCIVCAMATPLQPIPFNAAVVHDLLRLPITTVGFDVNTSCTSFITALNIVSHMNFNRVVIISGDRVSVAMDADDSKTNGLFGEVVSDKRIYHYSTICC